MLWARQRWWWTFVSVLPWDQCRTRICILGRSGPYLGREDRRISARGAELLVLIVWIIIEFEREREEGDCKNLFVGGSGSSPFSSDQLRGFTHGNSSEISGALSRLDVKYVRITGRCHLALILYQGGRLQSPAAQRSSCVVGISDLGWSITLEPFVVIHIAFDEILIADVIVVL